MKVLHVCKVFWPVRGGVQVVVERICQGLKESVLESSVLTTRRSKDENCHVNYANIESARSFGELFSLPLAPSMPFKLLAHARRFRLVAIHYPFPLADFAIALCPFKLPPIVVYWHSEIVSQKFFARLLKPFTKIMLRKASCIVVSSPALFQHSELLANSKDKVRVVPFGYRGLLAVGEQPRKGDFFLSIGRHVPYKGFDVLIKSIANTKAKVKIVGSGPLLDKHRNLVRQLGLQERVVFITEACDTEVEDLVRDCKALVLPSIYPSEAFALVQVEAMSAGKPVINTQLNSGVPWVARHMQEALTVSPGDVVSLTDAITQLDEDNELLEKLSRGAIFRWKTVFNEPDFLETTLSLYQELAE